MAAITISTIDEFTDFINGVYGYGTSDDFLNVTLENDLDFSELDDSDERKWSFNGSPAVGFIYVNFDGNGHEIKNLSYHGADQWSLFGAKAGSMGNLRNLTLRDCNIQTTGSIVIFCDQMNGTGTIVNCKALGFFSAGGDFKGFVQNYGNGGMKRCGLSGRITFGGKYYGLGWNYSGNGSSITLSWILADIVYTGTHSTEIYLIGNVMCIQNSWFRGTVNSAVALSSIKARGSSAVTCYNYVILMNAAEFIDSGATGTVFNPDNFNCWYNNDEYDYGSDTMHGTAKSNINTSWLREKGWPS